MYKKNEEKSSFSCLFNLFSPWYCYITSITRIFVSDNTPYIVWYLPMADNEVGDTGPGLLFEEYLVLGLLDRVFRLS